MRKLLTIACSIIVLFSACNKDLKNSEKFVGSYTGTMNSKESVTLIDPLTGNSTQNTNEFDIEDIKFSVTLGSQDDRVIVKVESDMDYPIDIPTTFNATVTKNTIVFDEVNFSIEVAPGIKVDTKTNASGTLDGNTLNFNAITDGNVGTIAVLEINSKGVANKDIIK